MVTEAQFDPRLAQQVARGLGVPEGTIKARVARARARLRSGIGLAAEEDA